jgi:hypothetical protein
MRTSPASGVFASVPTVNTLLLEDKTVGFECVSLICYLAGTQGDQ